MRSVLAEGGTAVILVPHNQWNFGTLDVVLGHYRRYSKESLRRREMGGRERRTLRMLKRGTDSEEKRHTGKPVWVFQLRPVSTQWCERENGMRGLGGTG